MVTYLNNDSVFTIYYGGGEFPYKNACKQALTGYQPDKHHVLLW